MAKIAHGYSIAHYGLGSFEAFLPPLILGEVTTPRVLHLVGGELEVPEPTPPYEHTVHHETWATQVGETIICARIRLFAGSETPIYRVVVGKLISK